MIEVDARSLTYRTGKRLHRLATAGREGAYLIVLPASRALVRHDPYKEMSWTACCRGPG